MRRCVYIAILATCLLVSSCSALTSNTDTLVPKDVIGTWKGERHLWWFADNGTGTIRTYDGSAVALEEPFVWRVQESNVLVLRSPEGEKHWLIDDYVVSRDASLRGSRPVLTLRRLGGRQKTELVWFAKSYSEIE